MKLENWFAIEITAEPKVSEAIEFAFNELGSLGNEINNLGRKKSAEITVIGYFNDLPAEEPLQNTLKNALRIYNFPFESIKSIETKKIEDQDWLAEWKKHWKPTQTGKFIIAPPWEEVESDSKIIIRIEPNMAFGTGTHETTRLCLKAIEENYSPEMSFFDVGTGTGILSIAVSKLRSTGCSVLGTEQAPHLSTQYPAPTTLVSACDIDEDSIKIAFENARLNETEEIDFFIGSISEESPKFDFVCANVTADIIVPMLPLLVEKSEKILLLSGILAEQKDLIIHSLRDLKVENPVIETEGDWISIFVRFPN